MGECHKHKQIIIELPYHLGKGSWQYFHGAIKGLLSVEDFQNCKVEFV